jgi:hypothetical protein
MTNILVLDLETTGLSGIAEGDRIVEVAVASVDIERQSVRPVFTAPVHYDALTDAQANSYIFREGHMDVEDILEAPFDEDKVAAIVANILEGEFVTSFNTEFDLDRFLLPWLDKVVPEMDVMFFRAPCLMRASAQVMDIPRKIHDDGSCWPGLSASYYTLCRDYRDQLFPHHAQDDCIMAGRVLLALYEKGLYDPESEEEY